MARRKTTNLKLVETQQNVEGIQKPVEDLRLTRETAGVKRELRQKRHQRRSPMARYPFADMSRREAER